MFCCFLQVSYEVSGTRLVFSRCNCCGDFCIVIRKRGVRLCCHNRLSIIIVQIGFCGTWGIFGDEKFISLESYTVRY